MSRILITGASGAMGYYLARHIQGLNEGHVVYGIGRKDASKVKLTGLDYYQTPNDMRPDVVPDIVFHVAGNAHVRDSFDNVHQFISDNVSTTATLLDLYRRFRDWREAPPKFILISSSEVYGNVPQEDNPIAERKFVSTTRRDDDICVPIELAPCNPYAATKAMQEILCSTYSRIYGFPLITTRAFGYINPRRSDLVATALARQIVDVERGKASEVVHGDLRPVRSFADARDIAAAYWLAATKCEPGVYNIGSETPCSIAQLMQGLAGAWLELTGNRDLTIEFNQTKDLLRTTDIFHCVPDCAKFRAATGWTPKYTLDESLKWLLEEVRR